MARGGDILIAGGYGVVGRRGAAALAPDHPGRVVVDGRSAERAAGLAAELGHGARGRRGDVGDPRSVAAAQDGIGTVLSCIDQPESHLLQAAITGGLAYTDIAPHLITRRPTDAMRAEAARSGARIVLGAGLAPGISSVLARLAADQVGTVEVVASTVLLSVDDAFGPASRAYLLDELALPYAVPIDSRAVPTRPFARPTRVRFPPPVGVRTAYRFPFSDQVFFPETLGARTAVSRLALDPPWLGNLLSAFARPGLASALRRRAGAQARLERVIPRLQRHYTGRDRYGAVVEVRGTGGAARTALPGHGQATGTALGAAGVVQSLIEGEVERPGIRLAEQVIAPGPFFDRLAVRGLVPWGDACPT